MMKVERRSRKMLGLRWRSRQAELPRSSNLGQHSHAAILPSLLPGQSRKVLVEAVSAEAWFAGAAVWGIVVRRRCRCRGAVLPASLASFPNHRQNRVVMTRTAVDRNGRKDFVGRWLQRVAAELLDLLSRDLDGVPRFLRGTSRRRWRLVSRHGRDAMGLLLVFLLGGLV